MDIDFQTIGLSMAGVSFGIIAVMMIAAGIFPEEAGKYKKLIGTVVSGLLLLMVSGLIVSAFGGGG